MLGRENDQFFFIVRGVSLILIIIYIELE